MLLSRILDLYVHLISSLLQITEVTHYNCFFTAILLGNFHLNYNILQYYQSCILRYGKQSELSCTSDTGFPPTILNSIYSIYQYSIYLYLLRIYFKKRTSLPSFLSLNPGIIKTCQNIQTVDRNRFNQH